MQVLLREDALVSEARQELGRRIREAREARGLTQRALANTLDITTGTVSRWERGENLPETKTLLEVAHALERDMGYFMAHLDGPAPSDGDETRLTPEMVRQAVREEVEELREALERLQKEVRRARTP